MENNISLKIKNCINNAHSFSKGLDKSTSIHFDYLVNNITNIKSTEIHIELLDLKDKGKIDYNSDTGIIILKENNIE